MKEAYKPEDHYGEPYSDSSIFSDYCNDDWQYAVNFGTYTLLGSYDPEVHKDGIDENGIVGTYEEQIPEGPAE
jgi:hypothetical protein